MRVRNVQDSTLAIFPLFVNRSPLYYDNPDEFNPDNFLPEACRGRKPYTYLTFGAGPRKCLGMNYAMLQLKVILSTLIRKNRFLPADRCPTPQHLKTKFSFTFKFVDGCYVKIKRRTPWWTRYTIPLRNRLIRGTDETATYDRRKIITTTDVRVFKLFYSWVLCTLL